MKTRRNEQPPTRSVQPEPEAGKNRETAHRTRSASKLTSKRTTRLSSTCNGSDQAESEDSDLVPSPTTKFQKGDSVMAMRVGGLWALGKILRVEEGNHPDTGQKVLTFFVKYNGWGVSYNEWHMADSLILDNVETRAKMEEINQGIMKTIVIPQKKKSKRKSNHLRSSAKKSSKRRSKPCSASLPAPPPNKRAITGELSSESSGGLISPVVSDPVTDQDRRTSKKRSLSPDPSIRKTSADADTSIGNAERTDPGELTFRISGKAPKSESFLVRDDDDVQFQPMYDDGVFTIMGEKEISVDDAIKEVVNRKVSGDESIRKMIAQAADCGSPTSLVRLICPLSRMRMDIPARGIYCQHTECFDAASFVRMNATPTGRWICPRCSSFTPVNEVIVDKFFESLLHFFKADCVSVTAHDKCLVIRETNETVLCKKQKKGTSSAVVQVNSDSDDDDDIMIIDTIVLD